MYESRRSPSNGGRPFAVPAFRPHYPICSPSRASILTGRYVTASLGGARVRVGNKHFTYDPNGGGWRNELTGAPPSPEEATAIWRHTSPQTMVIPQLEGNNPGQLLADAYRHVHNSTLGPAGRADLLEMFILQIENRIPGWRLAARLTGTDGAVIFSGEAGEAAVVSPQGQVFTGSIRPGSPGFSFGPGGTITPNYPQLRQR